MNVHLCGGLGVLLTILNVFIWRGGHPKSPPGNVRVRLVNSLSILSTILFLPHGPFQIRMSVSAPESYPAFCGRRERRQRTVPHLDSLPPKQRSVCVLHICKQGQAHLQDCVRPPCVRLVVTTLHHLAWTRVKIWYVIVSFDEHKTPLPVYMLEGQLATRPHTQWTLDAHWPHTACR